MNLYKRGQGPTVTIDYSRDLDRIIVSGNFAHVNAHYDDFDYSRFITANKIKTVSIWLAPFQAGNNLSDEFKSAQTGATPVADLPILIAFSELFPLELKDGWIYALHELFVFDLFRYPVLPALYFEKKSTGHYPYLELDKVKTSHTGRPHSYVLYYR
jgi:hypothetical protein